MWRSERPADHPVGSAHAERMTGRAEGPPQLVWSWLCSVFPARYPKLKADRGEWLTMWWAPILLGAPFAALFGRGVVDALLVLARGVAGSGVSVSPTWAAVEQDSLLSLVVIVLALSVARGLGLTLREAGMGLPQTGSEWARHGTVFLLALGWMSIAMIVSLRVRVGGVAGYPVPTTWGPQWWRLLAALPVAGPQEEVLLIGLVALVLRRIGLGWGWVVAIATVARLSFHLYYGLEALVLVAVWVPPMVLLWRRTGALWAIAAAHSVLDLSHGVAVAFLTYVGGWHAQGPLVEVVAVVLVVLAATIGLAGAGTIGGIWMVERHGWLPEPPWSQLWSAVRRDWLRPLRRRAL